MQRQVLVPISGCYHGDFCWLWHHVHSIYWVTHVLSDKKCHQCFVTQHRSQKTKYHNVFAVLFFQGCYKSYLNPYQGCPYNYKAEHQNLLGPPKPTECKSNVNVETSKLTKWPDLMLVTCLRSLYLKAFLGVVFFFFFIQKYRKSLELCAPQSSSKGKKKISSWLVLWNQSHCAPWWLKKENKHWVIPGHTGDS